MALIPNAQNLETLTLVATTGYDTKNLIRDTQECRNSADADDYSH